MENANEQEIVLKLKQQYRLNFYKKMHNKENFFLNPNPDVELTTTLESDLKFIKSVQIAPILQHQFYSTLWKLSIQIYNPLDGSACIKLNKPIKLKLNQLFFNILTKIK